MLLRCSCLLLLGACGRLDFGNTVDGAANNTGDASDATSAVRCDPATPFSTPTRITSVNSAVYDSTFTPVPGELTAYFYSNRGGTHDLYVATRPDMVSDWNVALVAPLSTTTDIDKEPAPSPDGKLIAFSSNRAPSDAGGDLYLGNFDGTTYTLVGSIANLNGPTIDYHPYFQDATTLWFSSNRTGNLGMYRSTYLGNNSFSAPVQMTDLDLTGFKTEVSVISPDGLTMYFRSNRPGGMGLEDIWLAQRATTADLFANPVPVTELNSPVLDTPNWISPDLCRIYLSSSRDDASEIYIASRMPP